MGSPVNLTEGSKLNSPDGWLVGEDVGSLLGIMDDSSVEAYVDSLLGIEDDSGVGVEVAVVGSMLGMLVDSSVGVEVGWLLGKHDGIIEGVIVGGDITKLYPIISKAMFSTPCAAIPLKPGVENASFIF